ncbi:MULTISPECIES: RraA family protein [Gemella]|uniref:RraA family protein n=1 Tax=Gemella TaxID=1378 RepID=UPI0007682A9F|nr:MULTISPECIES: RraA family protein [Gemella]AME09957.1 dimethylmenaquinone methyltransferase [Gemella sp. oral taxon 928]AXI26097.1 dimethylmenaquinone methyltransferase [Gemella sp. ND 6198]
MNLTEEVRQKLLKLPTGNIADNNNLVPNQGVMDTAIKPVDFRMKMVGRAFTARCFPGDNLALHQAIYASKPGDVLILDLHGYVNAGHFGDIMATACKLHGLAGIVIDGSCRDAEDIKKLGFPVFSRGFNPSGTVKESLAQLDIPVHCGGIQINPGDIIVGDCDGVVVIPKEYEDKVFEKALAKFDHEVEVIRKLKQGKTTLEIYGFDKIIKEKSILKTL